MRITVNTRLIITLLILIINIAGCGSAPEEESRIFRFRLASDPPALDPIHCTDTSSASVVFRMFEGLIEQDPATLEIVPMLAKRWEISEDGTTYTFHLKKNVMFHNGRAVTSADFRYSFERCLIPRVRVSLEAFSHYHGEKPGIERVDFEIIKDLGVAYQKFVGGELDLVNEILPGQLKLIRERYPEAVKVWSYLRNEYIGFNHTRPPFKGNKKLRQALCWAVDRKRIVDDLFEGAAISATGILPPGIKGRDDTLEGYGYDLDMARQLLAEAGYPGGKGLPELTLWYNTNEMHQLVIQYIQDNFRKIGVKVQLRSLDWPAYLKACESHEPDMYRLGWVADIADADNFLYILLHSLQLGPPGNYSGYSNPEFDRLVDEARSTTDPKSRIELYKQADRLATEDACWILYVYPMQQMLINPDYEGLVLTRQGDFRIPIEKLRYKGPGS